MGIFFIMEDKIKLTLKKVKGSASLLELDQEEYVLFLNGEPVGQVNKTGNCNWTLWIARPSGTPYIKHAQSKNGCLFHAKLAFLYMKENDIPINNYS